jgi:predicted TIM-barrel fold metal-dependent hydrolase
MLNKTDSNERFYCPYVEERERLDNGFSAGWGFQFQPSEEYWIDCHNHLDGGKTHAELYRILDLWFSRLDAYRLGNVLFIAGHEGDFQVYGDVCSADDRADWMLWLPHDKPDTDLLGKALKYGVKGLKLHNNQIMRGQGEHDVWLSDKWSQIFKMVEEAGIPVLWHVTQRHSNSPYQGGGENAYWADGWKVGVNFTNEDLLQVMLEVLRKFPKMNVIGAHQLHVGLERLTSLLDKYKNLFIDTSCGFYTRWADQIYEEDRKKLYRFVTEYADRILFGTDSNLTPAGAVEYAVQGFLCHSRFIHQLRLDYDTLQKIAHGNSEKLFGIKKLSSERKGNVRP